jgi:hypothetical protein
MELTHAQKAQIWREGWTRVEGVVAPKLVDNALRAINHSIGENLDPTKMTQFSSVSFCPELQSEPVILDLLFGTPLWSLVISALGVDDLPKPKLGQIALRFPGMADPPGPPQAHLDGTYGEVPGHVSSFTMLAGVMLTDVPTEDSGNFTVWPGSHHPIEAYARERGPRILTQGRPQLPLPAPHQVTGRAGDVVLAHYLLPHCAAENASPFVRYAVFFRIKYPNESRKWDSLTDMWRDWPGLAEHVQRPAPIADAQLSG